jgi:hypothetical protein
VTETIPAFSSYNEGRDGLPAQEARMGRFSSAAKQRPVGIWLAAAVCVTACLGIVLVPAFSLGYSESKGPYKNWLQAADLNGDGQLDVLVSHTRWEDTALSWAGVGRWINQGGGLFALQPVAGTDNFNGFAGAAGDVDLDGDADVFVQEFGTRLLINQGGRQGGKMGVFTASAGINAPAAYSAGYRDMGGTIVLGDLNGDGLTDAFTAGCCFGSFDSSGGAEAAAYAPSVSWVWTNDRGLDGLETGHITALDFLNGVPIRQAALGDLDGDGDLDIFAAVGAPTLGTAPAAGSRLLLNDGTGRFSPAGAALGGPGSTSAALGDVNADGRLDVLVGTGGGAQLWLNLGRATNGEPAFQSARQAFDAAQTFGEGLRSAWWKTAGGLSGLYLPYGSTRTTTVLLADLDGDGDPDGLIGHVWGAEIWWNDGRGAFQRSAARITYPEDSGLTAADLDGDGDLDIFTAGNGGQYRVWWNDGRGNFSAGQN